ncbi:MAG: O-methyltransferase [Bacteroidia bacterium]|nr:O-methyltransferase [Bacteroidia bacterium]
MEFIDEALLKYAETHSDGESELLSKLNRETHLKVNSPRMLSGHLQGRFLSFISKMKRPDHILEIGTYTGYSALCLAEGLSEKGKLISIDPNEETMLFAKKFITNSALSSKIDLITGQAQTIIPTLKQIFDIVFIDADKKNYSLYFDLAIDKVSKGGLIIADNVLWSGKVIEQNMDAETKAIHEFNQKVAADKRLSTLLLPIRDGLMIMTKL